MLTVDILFSGSSGNCTLVRSGETQILIDCGRNAKAVCTALRELGTDIENIAAIFVTHEHVDHISALDVICSRHRIPVHMTEKSFAKVCGSRRFAEYVVTHPTEYTVSAGGLTVSSFPLPHDSADHVGFVIEDSDGDAFGVATDMGHVTERAEDMLSRCRRAMIEANHDVEILMWGRYPEYLKRRILSPRGHLSNEDCAELACTLAGRGCEIIALAHLSAENNDVSVAYTEVRRALRAAGYRECEIVVADREHTVHIPNVPFGAVKKDVSYAEN